jgi:chemotaxis signal transduction protein
MSERTLITLEFEDNLYGVWEDEVLRTAEVGSVSTIPMTPAYFAGVADIDRQTVSLFDLSASLGHQKIGHASRGQVLVLDKSEDKIEGFVCDKELGRAELHAGGCPSAFPGLPGVPDIQGVL